MANRPDLNDSDRLLLFVHRMNELRKRTFYPYARASTLETELHVSPIGEEQFMAFLMSLRNFFMKSEPTHMGGIAKIVQKYARRRGDSSLLEAAQKADQTFRTSEPELEAVSDHDEVICRYTDDEVIDMWLNGRYFHNDTNGLIMLAPSSDRTMEKLKAFFLFSIVRHLQRLEAYQPAAKFIILNDDLPLGCLRPVRRGT